MSLGDLTSRFRLDADQVSALGPLQMDLGALGARAKKDEERIQLFLLAVASKEVEYGARVALILHESPTEARLLAEEAQVFSHEAAMLAHNWIAAGINAVKKLGFARLFGWDPFKDLRQQTRVFAAKWDMDPALRAALG